MRRTRGTRLASDLKGMPDATLLMGWCMPDTPNHGGCRARFTSSLTGATYTCSCSCHGVSPGSN